MTRSEGGSRPAFLFLGAPGAGKGTQGRVLGTIPRFFHCACGDVFRSLDTRSELGQQFIKYSSQGLFVPDELTIQLWEAQLDNWAATNLYKPDIDILVLDGIPRNLNQAKILQDYIEVHQVFHLTCPDRHELARRMRKRALKESRIDDANEEVIIQRIETYEEETKPLLEFYPDEIVTSIDGTQQPVKVMHDILSKVITLDIYQKMSQTLV